MAEGNIRENKKYAKLLVEKGLWVSVDSKTAWLIRQKLRLGGDLESYYVEKDTQRLFIVSVTTYWTSSIESYLTSSDVITSVDLTYYYYEVAGK